jgi:GAF domain-containing protein
LHAHLEGRVRDLSKELAALNAIAAVVSQSLDLDSILNDALDTTLDVMGVEAGGIYLLDEENGVLNVAAQRGFGTRFVTQIDRLRLGEGLSGSVAQSGEPLVVRDVSTDPRLTRMAVREEKLHSLAIVPLSSRGKVQGTLFAVTRGYREFTEQDLRLLISIGHQIAVAIENARLLAIEQRRAEEFRLISEVGRRITSILPVEELLADIVHVLKETLGYYLVGIGLIEEDELVFKAGAGAVWEADDFRPPRLKVGQEGITGWVALSGEPLLVPDVSQEHRYYSLPQAGEIRSELAVPLKIKGVVIGVLHVQSDCLNAFNEHDLTVLQSLAHQAALAIDNARLFEAERRRQQEATLLAEMAKLISGTLDLGEVLQLTAAYAIEVFGVDCCCILLYDEGAGTLKLAVQIGMDDTAARNAAETAFTASEKLRQTVFDRLQPLIVEDVPAAPHISPHELLDLQSALIVPIEVGGRRLGLLQLSTHGPGLRRFSTDEGGLAQAMANQAAVAIENADLFDAEQRRAEQFRVISEVGRHVTSLLAVDEILEQIVRLVKETLGYHQVGIGLIEGDEVVYRTGVGSFWEQLESQPIRLKAGREGISGLVTQTGEPVLVPDVSQEPRYHRVPGDIRTKSELAVPLKTKAAVIGVLAVSSDRLDGFDETDVAVLQSLAHQAALAIENARLFEAEQVRAEQFRVISEVGSRITSILAVDELLGQMTRLVKDAFDYHGVGIGLIEGDQLVFKAGAGTFWDDPQFEPLSLKVGQEGITGWVASTGEPLLVPDVSKEPRYYLPSLSQARKTHSELAVPMKIKGEVIGVLDVESERLDAFDENDLVVLQSLASQAAVAIENARLFDAEQRQAEQFRVMSEVGRRITSILDIDQVLVQVVRLIQEAFDYDQVHIGLIEGDYVVYRHGAGWLWEDPQFEFRPNRLRVGQDGVTGLVADTGKPLLVPDVSKDPRYLWMEGSRTRSELTVPIKFKGKVIGVLDAQSDRLDAFGDSDLVVLQSLANQAAIAIDNARLFRDAARQVRDLTALADASRIISSVLHQDQLLEALYQQITRIAPTDFYLIALYDEATNTVSIEINVDEGVRYPKEHYVLDRGLLKLIIHDRQVLRFDSLTEEKDKLGVEVVAAGSPKVNHGWLGVPMLYGEKVVGAIVVASYQRAAFDERHEQSLSSIANQAAVALENARLYQQAQQLAVLQERQRLARDLHDAVTQTLFSASLIAEALPAVWEADREDGRQLLRELRQLNRGALAEMRTLLLELRPAALVEAHLDDLLRQLTEAIAGRTGLPTTVKVEGTCMLPPEVHVALYRIAQEALNNIVKHARASSVEVLLRCTLTAPGTGREQRQRAELHVSDDGCGFDPHSVPPDRLGLSIIRERAQAVGATVEIESRPRQGTRLVAVWEEAER